MSQKFTVTFYDEDEKTILDRQEVNRGDSVKYQGKTPEKPSINGIEYTFNSWKTTGNIMMVMEDIDLFAKYDESSKASEKKEVSLFELSEKNAESAKLNEVTEAGNKVEKAEKATRDMTLDEKKDLINQVKDKGAINLDKQVENERD